MDDATAPIEKRVGEALRETDATVAVAESCTGGLVGSLLTDVPGSSDYFDRSVVTYSNDAKQDVLAVSREHLDSEGAVSPPVAREMARGVRDTAGTTWGVATRNRSGRSISVSPTRASGERSRRRPSPRTTSSKGREQSEKNSSHDRR